MSTPAMVPMFAPDGTLGDIPANRVQDAVKAGGKQAYYMVAPDGSTGYIPQDRVHDALQAGGKLGSPDSQPSTLSQYAKALFNPVGSGAHAQGVVGGVEQAAGRAMQGILAPVMHPVDTVTGVVNAVAHPIDTARARISEFQQEWKQDPALALENAAGDVAGTVEGGRMGAAAAKVAAPYVSKVAGRAALLGKTPEAAYESALKPSTTLSQAQRQGVIQTGLQEGIPVSKQGLEDISGKIADLNQKIKDTIAADPTRPISPVPALRNLQSVRAKFATQVNPTADVNAVDAAGQEFADQLSNGQPGPNPQRNLGAAEAQAMKTGTYRALGDKSYGELKGASVEAQKALARGLKDEIAKQFPEISNLNGSESRLLDLKPVLERAVNRISNHQIIGIGTPVAGAAAEAVTGSGSVGLVAGALKAVLDNPMVKSRLAIAVSKGAGIPLAQAAGKVAAYSSALGATVASASGSQPGGAPAQ